MVINSVLKNPSEKDKEKEKNESYGYFLMTTKFRIFQRKHFYGNNVKTRC